MLLRILTVYLAVITGTAWAAGWDTNCWPLYEHPRQYGLAESNMVQQINARASLVGGGSTATSLWRSRRSNLALLKLAARSLVPGPGWIRPDVATNPIYWLSMSNTLPTYATIGDVISDCPVPTNILDYTPWRDLAGVGGHTNDLAAIGRPHGITNAYTAAGGSNYPPGRSCWYTTDYGPDQVRMILEKLTIVHASNGSASTLSGLLYSGWGAGSDLASAQAAALSSFAVAGAASYPRQASALYTNEWSAAVWLRSSRSLMKFGNIHAAASNYNVSVAAFSQVTVPQFAFPIVMDTNTFDGFGAYAVTGWNEVAGPYRTNVANVQSIVAWMGSTNPAPAWPLPAATNWISRGWEARDNYQAMVTIFF